jgi:methionine biosynthesis protein MetW
MNELPRLYAEIWERKLAGPLPSVPANSRLAVGAAVTRRYAGGALLDAGCGDGTLAALVARDFAALHGVELTLSAARQAAGRGVAVALADLDRGLLPYADGRFDLVTCLDVIEHVLDPAHLLREIARVLRPGGHCLLSTPNISYWRHLRRLVLDGRFPRTSDDVEGYDGGHLHYFTYRDVEALLRDARLLPVARFATYGGRGRRLPRPIRERPRLQEFLATGLFVAAQRPAVDPV